MVNYICDRVENIVGKGGNAGYQHFLLFPQCFQKSGLCGEKVKDESHQLCLIC